MQYKVKLVECLDFGTPTIEQIDKIIGGFLIPLNVIRERMGIPIHVRSCFRSIGHEIKQGRSGKSQHTFTGLGACDVALTKSSSEAVNNDQLFLLAQQLLQFDFKRIAYYPHLKFFHIDYNAQVREFNISDNDSKWQKVNPEQFYKSILNNEPK